VEFKILSESTGKKSIFGARVIVEPGMFIILICLVQNLQRISSSKRSIGERVDPSLTWNMYKMLTTIGDPLSNRLINRQICRDLGSYECFQLARTWISACSSQHLGCILPETPLLPTRIVNVGNSDRKVRLELGARRRSQYVALSYCWGKKQSQVATSRTLHSFSRHLKMEGLPKTIRDAITATRQLGYRFLWVDALCIIQDSASDKAEEISKMSEIYSKSVVTISAEDSKDGNEGFLRALPADVSGNKEFAQSIPYLDADGKSGYISLREKGLVVSNGAIHRRAWKFQEHFLSRRVLYFGNSLHWQCQEGQIYNIESKSDEDATAATKIGGSFGYRTLDLLEKQQIYTLWLEIVKFSYK
jgi:hypothetical protein